MSPTTWIMGTLLRWFPHRASPGLRTLGNPGEHSPVLVTGNYRLTLARLLKHLSGLDLWLLVVNSSGINVWCAACGGLLTEHQVISSVKASMLTEKVKHRTLILPPLAASGVDTKQVKKETGYRVRFGPVRAKDIPAYLAAGNRATSEMKRARFGLRHRLDMLISMNFILWLPPAVVFAIGWPGQLAHLSILFWGLVAFSYVAFPWIPGSNGWLKALVVALLAVSGYLAAGAMTTGEPLTFWPWMLGSALLSFAIGFDLAGIAGPLPSDAEAFLQRLGHKNLGSLFTDRRSGRVQLDREKCRGCYPFCSDICPVGVHEPDASDKKIFLARPEECFGCGACVKQCPFEALILEPVTVPSPMVR